MTSRRNFPTIALADLGATSGWLVPIFYAQEAWKINPNPFWHYREGRLHLAYEIALRESRADLTSDYDRIGNAMISSDRIKKTHKFAVCRH